MAIQITAIDGGSKLSLSEGVFGVEFNEGLVHQSVTAYLANARKWSAKKKSRSEVRGGGAKPWRQKGTGRARAGTIRSPIWVGGGKTFAPDTINYSQKVNKKMYRKSMQCILSELVKKNVLKSFEGFSLDSPKTKGFLEKFDQWKTEGRTLMVFTEVSENIYLASRNLENVDVIDHTMINPYMLLAYQNVLIDASAFEKIEERLK